MPSIATLVGNPQPGSRTYQLAVELSTRIAGLTGASELPPIDLAEHTQEIFRWPSDTLDPLLASLAAADIAVIATPTYKASYTGLLKGFLDRFGTNGLAGVTAVPVFTIGSLAHALAVEHTLRPLLVELGASVPTRGLAFETSRFDERAELLDAWLAEQGGPLLSLSAAAGGAAA